jgi:acyl carrier protein
MSNFEKLQGIFRKVFNDNTMVIKREMVDADVEDWDSLAQMQLISAAEAEFQIEFTLEEVLSFQNIGDFIDCIESKL